MPPTSAFPTRPSAVKEVHIVWLTDGLSCDGDSVSVTAAEQPSIEDVLLGAIPGIDVALAARIGIVESIEQDFDNRTHIALVIEDDLGKDLGFMRQPGHRFFFYDDEVEQLA